MYRAKPHTEDFLALVRDEIQTTQRGLMLFMACIFLIAPTYAEAKLYGMKYGEK